MDCYEIIKKLCDEDIPVNSKLFRRRWSEIQESASLKIESPVPQNVWRYLMRLLAEADVSRIQHLVLYGPVLESPWISVQKVRVWKEESQATFSTTENVDKLGELGKVLETGRFSALKTLRILPNCYEERHSILTEAFRKGQFINLRTLSLPNACDVASILVTLSEGHISQLSSLSITGSTVRVLHLNRKKGWISQQLDAVLRSGCFKRLVHLDLCGVLDVDSWKVFTEGLRSGLLPNMKSLRLCGLGLNVGGIHAADLGLVHGNWFSSLEELIMDSFDISPDNVSLLVKEIMTTNESGLALKCLGFPNNCLGNEGVGALVNLADSDRLRQLEDLDLSRNEGVDSKALENLMKTIRRGHMPSLQSLKWGGNPVSDATAEAIAEAYYENEDLTADVDIDWISVSDLSLRTKVAQYRDRNIRLTGLKKQLEEVLQDVVPLTCAKVFLCGFPEVGKTTLRRTLQRQLGLRTTLSWETRPNPFKKARTRGIELSRIEDKRNSEDQTALVLWDLAGQEEYHVLHGTFLADLGFAGGRATTFLLVFRAAFNTDVEEKLLYWLRFVNSSSLQHVMRHVVIVLNRFNGKYCTESEKRFWMVLIKRFAELFSDSLDICLDPFVIDVRVAASVEPLKKHLFDQARRLLQAVEVPRVCFELLKELQGWSQGQKDKSLPIFSWQAFEGGTRLEHKGNRLSGKTLKTVASYLHEMGEIIYLDKEKSSEPQSMSRSIVVPNPQWFCKQVVGQLLLPKEMLRGRDSPLKVSDDGSISLILFQAFFEHLLIEGIQSDDVIAMLELLGLCYRKGEEKIIVPALIRHDDYSSLDWEMRGFYGVMGRCLATEDHERTAIPLTLFQRLQVDLAQDLNFGGRGDSGYRAGKSFSTFKVGELLVLIQFDVDHSHPADDRIDILVKSLVHGDPVVVSVAQVKCICEILQKVEVLCVTCCPGLRYDIKVIKPWNATEKTPNMIEREMMSLREIKNLLMQRKKNSGWQLNKYPVELRTFLSDNELKEVFGVKTVAEIPDAPLEEPEVRNASDVSLGVTIEQEYYDDCKRDVVTMGLMTQASLQNLEESGEENCSNAPGLPIERALVNDISEDTKILLHAIHGEGHLTRHAIQGDGHLTRQHMDKRSEELLLEIRHKHGDLVRHIQAQQTFSIEESERSVPRFMYLSKKKGQSRVWISLKEAFKSDFKLHLLCEAHFDDGFLHEVKDQEGIEMRNKKEWLVKVSPWLRRSLQVAIMVGIAVGNLYLPGFFNVIPDFLGDRKDLAKAVDYAAKKLLEEDKGANQVQDVQGNYGTATQPINLKEMLIAQEVVKDLINQYTHTTFVEKIGLRKVLLRATAQPQVGCSQQAQQSVLWICDDCYKKYGKERVTDI